jgi:hypothetical protein
MIALVIPLFLADSAALRSRSYEKPTSAQLNAYVNAVKQPLAYGLIDPHNKILVATVIAEAGRVEQGATMLKEVIADDPRSFEALTTLSSIYEQTNKVADAIPLRRKMVALDPFNQKILLKLGEDLKATGDKAGAKAVIPLIDAFAASTPEAASAHKELGA